ncbi:cytidylyltransferase [candidate division KSB1 bacterium]|nr:cytidylyltransferase [candidate division KSB1 bacterium]
MIAALIIGRAGSTGYKGKNLKPIVGRPLMAYPILAAKGSKYIDKVYMSTDSEEMKEIARSLGVEIINRPESLATKEALSEDAFLHGYRQIKEMLGGVEFFVPMFANGATITPGILDEGITLLRNNPDADSAVTVSIYNMWSPLRARKVESGLVKPYLPVDFFDNVNCDRDSQGDVYFVDCSGFVVRPKCMEDYSYGEPPFRWIGQNVLPLKQWGGLDIDYEWQVGQVEFWLRQHGFTEEKTPYDGM